MVKRISKAGVKARDHCGGSSATTVESKDVLGDISNEVADVTSRACRVGAECTEQLQPPDGCAAKEKKRQKSGPRPFYVLVIHVHLTIE